MNYVSPMFGLFINYDCYNTLKALILLNFLLTEETLINYLTPVIVFLRLGLNSAWNLYSMPSLGVKAGDCTNCNC